MIATKISKYLTWFYNIKIDYENDTIKLVGFAKNGSITSNRIDYKDYLNLSFDVLIYPDVLDMSAILDIDFNHRDQRYFSVIIKDNQIRLLARESGVTTIIGVLDYNKDWMNVKATMSLNNLIINVEGYEMSHVFQNSLSPCSISFGNNYPFKAEHVYSFGVKNIEVSTENGVFPLIIENLIENEDRLENI